MNLRTDIFAEIGIEAPALRVAHCEALETEEHPYTIKLNFIGLKPADLQQIRVYCNKARVNRAASHTNPAPGQKKTGS